jgi:hypothetical protein
MELPAHQVIGLVVSGGASSGLGLVVAHELLHKSTGRGTLNPKP